MLRRSNENPTPRPLSMPELPEVETVRRGLLPVLEGKRIAKLDQNRKDLRFPLPADFAARVRGRKIERLERRAKYLLAHLSGGDVLLMHLGMTGSFTVHAVPPGDVAIIVDGKTVVDSLQVSSAGASGLYVDAGAP